MTDGDDKAETLDGALPDALQRQAHRVLDLAHERKLSLATAESCTGGLLAALLTDVGGRGHVFDRGFVTYAEESKCDLLGVDPNAIDRVGAVSEDVARAMAEGAIARSDADVALSVTGFAGPGAPGDEEGLVHFACATRAGGCAHREEHFGAVGRAGVRIAALEVALAMMEDALHR
ncbi:CinA family protein [Tsuneonella sp. YG55]|uniref:CinA family protein n=1 Tax=Tsuneonella litorea TaxID=2976475 RepID=A0A9X2W0E4_9SPHN|nr:CinA family protein [Tsuneonella litorea]MCT2558412.1 CinA family protein [Tsuneonella litorea]